jgi:hypothetical protein
VIQYGDTMIIKPKMNQSFPAMCRYVLQEKNQEKKTEVLAVHGVRSDSAAHMAADFDVVRSMRPGLGKAVMHVIIAFPSEEKGKVTNEMMTNIARDYLKEMKISSTNTQWAAVRHNDKDHPHLHLIVNRVDLNGQTVSDKFCRSRSVDAAKKLERTYGLVVADHVGQKQAREIGPTPAQVKAKTVREIRLADWSRARQDIGRALGYTRGKPRSFEELGELLRPRSITTELYRDKEGNLKGVVFALDGHRVKGTHLGKEYRFPELTAAFDKARTVELARDPAPSLQKVAQDYSLAKVLDGYAQAKEKARSASPRVEISKSTDFGIGD